MTDMLTNHARALALRGKLIGAGFDPLTVAYDDKSGEYIIQIPYLQCGGDLYDWLENEGLHLRGPISVDADALATLIAQ